MALLKTVSEETGATSFRIDPILHGPDHDDAPVLYGNRAIPRDYLSAIGSGQRLAALRIPAAFPDKRLNQRLDQSLLGLEILHSSAPPNITRKHCSAKARELLQLTERPSSSSGDVIEWRIYIGPL
jgi:hypothetical protein